MHLAQSFHRDVGESTNAQEGIVSILSTRKSLRLRRHLIIKSTYLCSTENVENTNEKKLYCGATSISKCYILTTSCTNKGKLIGSWLVDCTISRASKLRPPPLPLTTMQRFVIHHYCYSAGGRRMWWTVNHNSEGFSRRQVGWAIRTAQILILLLWGLCNLPCLLRSSRP